MERAMQIVEAEGIVFAFKPLPPAYLGVFHRQLLKPSVIIVNKAIESGPTPILKSVVYEELGHYYTLQTTDIYGRWPVSSQRVYRSVQEARALRWAAGHVLTFDDWEATSLLSVHSAPALAALWDVTLELATVIVEIRGQRSPYCQCLLCKPSLSITQTGYMASG